MSSQSTCQFPNPFDRIQLRAIRRQEIETKMFFVRLQPWLNQFGVMPSSVIQDNDHFSVFTAMGQQFFQEGKEAFCAKCLGTACHQATIVYADSPVYSDALACGCMKNNGVNFPEEPT